MTKPKISIIVAMDKNRGIGKTELGVGKLLWHISDDLKRFKELTTGHAVIMGRKTFESILSYLRKPLPNRTNIVITRNANYKPPYSSSEESRSSRQARTIIVSSLERALEEAKKIEKEEICVIGGGQIYEQALPFTDRLYLTLVDEEFDADTFFPDYSDFKKIISEEKHQTGEGVKYTWLTLER